MYSLVCLIEKYAYLRYLIFALLSLLLIARKLFIYIMSFLSLLTGKDGVRSEEDKRKAKCVRILFQKIYINRPIRSCLVPLFQLASIGAQPFM